MTVRVNKQSFNLREKLSELERPVGFKGHELMGAETVQDARNLVSAGRKNMVINGDMRVFQRNNAGNSANSNSYFLDRFMTRNVTNGTLHVNQQSGSGGPPGFRSWMLLECDGTDTTVDSSDYCRFQHYIEGYNCTMDWGYGNKDYVTVSFWVKSNKTGTYCFSIEDGDANPIYLREYIIEHNNVWQKVELNIPPPTHGTWRGSDTGIGARLTWCLMGGSSHSMSADYWNSASYGMTTAKQVNFLDNSNNHFSITGIQLEVGKNATDFEYRNFGEELALCQRYYFKTPTNNWMYALDNTNVYNRATIWHPVEMRANPSITWSPTVSGTSNGTQWGSTKKSILYVNSPGTIVSVQPGAEFSAEL